MKKYFEHKSLRLFVREIAEISQLCIQDWSHDSINQWSTLSRPFISRRRKSRLTVEPENGLFNYKKAKMMPKTNGIQNKLQEEQNNRENLLPDQRV